MLISHMEAHLAAAFLAAALAGCATPACTPPDVTDLLVDDKGAYIVPDAVLKARNTCARKP
jgi:hypothetical protein